MRKKFFVYLGKSRSELETEESLVITTLFDSNISVQIKREYCV